MTDQTAPRITPDDIEIAIKHEAYFTATEGCYGTGKPLGILPPSLGLITFCVLTLNTDFSATGEHISASLESFDAENSRKIAREKAINKILQLDDDLLKQQIHDSSTGPTRGQMIEYVQQAIKEGYTSYYGLPENGIAWLSDECLKVDYGSAWEYYNLAPDEDGKAPQRDLGE
ncbi:Gp49 family protein [Serratia fonticola]|uniref:Gp49 family protein n=1 Tax=Serratia fonticola TaxID=47917 RepID=UPI003AAD4302